MNFLKKTISSEAFFFFVVAALVLFVRLRYIDIALERDEGEYAYAAQEILRGHIPYLHFYNMKLPGTYFGYALMFWIGGDSVITIKTGLIILNALSTLMVFLIAQKIFDRKTAWLSAAVYLLYSLSLNALGFTNNAEHFVILPALVGIYFILQAYYKKVATRYIFYIMAGAFLAFAYICKQHAFGYILFLPLWLLIKDKSYASLNKFVKQFIAPMMAYGFGAAIVIGSMLFYFYQNNALKEWDFYTNKYALSYISHAVPFKRIWLFRPIFWDAPIFWFVQFAALYFAFRRPALFKERVFLLLFWFCTFLCIHPGWFYRPHYFQLMFPGAAIATGVGLTLVNDFWQRLRTEYTPSVFRWLALAACVISQFGYFLTWNNAETLTACYGNESFGMMRDIGNKLKKITLPNDKITILCPEPEILFYAQRQSASGFLYHYPLIENHTYADSMTRQFIRETNQNEPEILLFHCGIDNDINSDVNMETRQILINWFQNYSKEYELIGQLCTDENNEPQMNFEEEKMPYKEVSNIWFYILRKNKKNAK
jgi:4-amino-4-deoxy-L-arabinose transferase-like glycosyltransferase